MTQEGDKYDRPLSREGVVGHEQRHIKGAARLVNAKIVNQLLYKKGITSKQLGGCRNEVKSNANTARRALVQLLDPNKDNHADKHLDDKDYNDEPTTNGFYQYVDLVWQ